MLSSVDAIKPEFHLGPVNESFYICCAEQETSSCYTKSSSEQQQFSLVNWVSNRCRRRLRDTQERKHKVQQQIMENYKKQPRRADGSCSSTHGEHFRVRGDGDECCRCGSLIVVMLYNIKSTWRRTTKVLWQRVDGEPIQWLHCLFSGVCCEPDHGCCCWGGLNLLNLAGLYFHFSKRSSAPINRKVDAQLLRLRINPPCFAGLTGGPHWIPVYWAAGVLLLLLLLLLPAPSVYLEFAFDNQD